MLERESTGSKNAHIFKKPIKGSGRLHVFLVLGPANVENSGVVEKQFSPFPGESFAMRIDAGEIVARRSAYQEVERTPTGQIL